MARQFDRRAVLAGGAALAATLAAAAGAGGWARAMRPDETAALTPPEALAAMGAGTLVLVDVRRPDEWSLTGIAAGAVPIDMRRPDFVGAVTAARKGRDVPVAVICARGVRSRRMAGALREAGLGSVVDVPEGMLGSRLGPGWLARGLPVVGP